jgi:hypothetical protein
MKLFQIIFSIVVIVYGILLVLHDISIVEFDIEKYLSSTYVILAIAIVSSYIVFTKGKY